MNYKSDVKTFSIFSTPKHQVNFQEKRIRNPYGGIKFGISRERVGNTCSCNEKKLDRKQVRRMATGVNNGNIISRLTLCVCVCVTRKIKGTGCPENLTISIVCVVSLF